ncbi:MAG: methyltransferase domain-containing protein [Anaerolineae bacterium]|nr:methyltransferase domain-containing protein [Anaerolineae bacterium]
MESLDRLEYYRRRYALLRPGWQPGTARYERQVARHLTATTRVLDLGCGRGGIVERLMNQGQWIGQDPDWASVQTHRCPDLPRLQAISERLPFAPASFDIVVCSWVLEHVPDPAAIFKEITRVLRPGGRFIFLTPNARHPIPYLSRVLARLIQLQRYVVSRTYRRSIKDTFPVYYRANTPEIIDQAAVCAGLRLVHLTLVDDPAYFSWNEVTFQLAARMETLLPVTWKVHLIGEYRLAV